MGARLGVGYSGNMEKFRSDKQAIISYTRKVQDAYRRMITGSQANKYELKRIEHQMPNEKDDIGNLKSKMRIWQEETEKITPELQKRIDNMVEFILNCGEGSNEWHGDTFDLPEGAVRLASSEHYLNQAFQYKSAVGIQFHLEVNEKMVNLWLDNTEDKLQKISYIDPQKIRSDINENISTVKSNMKNFYNNFKSSFNL